VVSGVCDGFIGNRMIEQYGRQAGFLLEEGCTPQQVDRAMEKFGLAMGPFRMGDLAGNDIGWAIRKRRYVEKPDMRYSRTADLLCEMGRYGQKTSKPAGTTTNPGDRTAYPSPTGGRADRAAPHRTGPRSRAASPTRRSSTGCSTRWSTKAPASSRKASRRKASDIDIVYLTGYGFPLHRGGPMFHADTVGLHNVVSA
jgi:3-hydroxyacyl-CoA dehydrogenase